MGFLDLTGARFGHLVILSKTEKRRSTYVVWKAKCDCGRECEVTSLQLHYCENTACCGHVDCQYRRKANSHARVDLTGRVYGKLTCLEKTSRRYAGSIIWKCKCECGNIDEIPAAWLMHHGTVECSMCRFDTKHSKKKRKKKVDCANNLEKGENNGR
jgi:hypothetical protein